MPKRNALLHCCIGLFIAGFSLTLAAQEKSETAAPAIQGSDIRIEVRTTDKPIAIDGRLDDEAWKDAAAYEDFFFQQQPLDRAPSSEKTRVMVLQDRDTIYFGIQAYDSEPGKLFASAMRQDKDIWSDDVVELLIDTFRDFRNCYAFVTNPLGVKGDAIISDQGGDINKSWDCIWRVKSTVNERGWATEMAFPFKSLKYGKGDTVEWGLNISRNIRHRNETTYLVPIPRGLGHDGKFKGGLYAVMTNIRPPAPGINLEVQPYARGGVSRVYRPDHSDSESDAGLDVRYHVTPQFTVDATYNTDFAQVESEQEVVNVTRFNIYLPEKRDFFLENAGLFNFSMTSSAGEYYDEDADFILFNSRTIGIHGGKRTPLYGGAKVAGRIGKYSIGAMNIQSERTSLDGGAVAPSTNYSAFRVKRDIFSNSYLGLMVLNSQPGGGDWSRTLGADAYLAFTDEFNAKGSLARTFEEDDPGHDLAGDVRVSLVKDWMNVSVSHTSIDSLFNPAMGYVRRGNIRKTDGSLGFTKWINNRYIRSVGLDNSIVYTTDHADVLETRETESDLSVTSVSGESVSFEVGRTYDFLPEADDIRGITIDPGRYTATRMGVSLDSNDARRMAGSVSFDWGEELDGHSRRLTLTNRTNFSRHLNMDLSYVHNRLELAHGDLTANVLAGRWTYSFSTEMFAKAYIQWNDADKKISSNLLFDYIYSPKSHLYIVYNENRDTSLGSRNNTRDRIIQMKLTYLWNT